MKDNQKKNIRSWKPALVSACIMAALSAFVIANRFVQRQMEQRQLQNNETGIMTGDDFTSLRTRGDRYFESGFYNAAEAAYNRALTLASNEDDTDDIIDRLSIIYVGSQAAVDAYLNGMSVEVILDNPDQFIDQCGTPEGDSAGATENNGNTSCGCSGGGESDEKDV